VHRFAKVLSLATGVALGLALLPIWRLALDTPFRLIDDYLSWRDAVALHPLHYLRSLAFDFSGQRYRPVSDLGNLVCWSLLSTHYRLHHAVRLVLKVVAFWFFWRTVAAVARPLVTRWAEVGAPLFAWALALFFYFPNNPEARLIPQELATALALCWFTWALTGPSVASRFGYLNALASFIVFCLAKEPNAIAAVGLLLWLGWELARTRSRHRFLTFVPFLVVLVHTAVKVALASRVAEYGNAPISVGLVMANLRFAGRVILLPFASPWLTVALAAPLIALMRPAVAQARALVTRERERAGPCGVLFLALSTCLLLVAFLTSWIPVLRYAYPATVGCLALNCVGVAVIADRAAARWQGSTVACTVSVLALALAGASYHNVACQFASQSVAGRSERRVLDRAGQLLAAGSAVGVGQGTEFEWSLATYFNDFLPHFGGGRQRVATDPDALAAATYLVSRTPSVEGWSAAETIPPAPLPRLLSLARPVSSILQLRRREPYVFLDTGAQPIAYFPWYILRNVRGDRGYPGAAPPVGAEPPTAG